VCQIQRNTEISHYHRKSALPSELWHCWLGDRKGIRPVKTSASKHLWMVGNRSNCGAAWSTMWLQSFGLCCEDAHEYSYIISKSHNRRARLQV